MMLERIMLFDFPCSHLLYETIEEIRGLGLCIENILENSVDDVVWCVRETLDSSENLDFYFIFIFFIYKIKLVSGCLEAA